MDKKEVNKIISAFCVSLDYARTYSLWSGGGKMNCHYDNDKKACFHAWKTLLDSDDTVGDIKTLHDRTWQRAQWKN